MELRFEYYNAAGEWAGRVTSEVAKPPSQDECEAEIDKFMRSLGAVSAKAYLDGELLEGTV